MQMTNKRIENIIIKYLSNSASIDEIEELKAFIQIQSNAQIFENFIRTNYLINYNMVDFDTDKEISELLKRIKQKENKNRSYHLGKAIFKYAALAFLFLCIGYLIFQQTFTIPTDTIQKISVEESTEIKAGTNKAILTLENGKEVILDKNENTHLKNRIHTGEKLVYFSGNKKNEPKTSYNYLTIPRGGRFFVQLSDSTRVWLNSESKLKYPINFVKGESRNVELVYGEAYFDVSKSIKNSGSSFSVTTGDHQIEVLGTEFNVKAYKDEENITTTLVEGKVSIKGSFESTFLKPSQQALVNRNTKQAFVKEVDRMFDVIAWKDGYFNFNNKTMKEIMKILSRWYNIEYVFANSEKEKKRFTGVLDRESEINEILKYLQKTNEITFYIKGKTVTIE